MSVAAPSNLIVVSNRLPFVLVRNKEDGSLYRKSSAGGLVTAVAPVVQRSGGLWVGWPGVEMNETDVVPESDPDDYSPTAGMKSGQVVCVQLDQEEHQLYYNGCCNATFWPLFHSMPDRAIFSKSYWEAYRKVNDKFAAATMDALRKVLKDKGSDQVPIIWIHDYHLLLAASKIREMVDSENLQCKMGFFLHIPFPAWDIVKILPWVDDVLQNMLNCDLIGFHIRDYCLNFLECCQRGLGSRVDTLNMLAEYGGRTVRIRELPIGIPFQHFETLAKSAPDTSFSNKLQVILGVDRLDYTKGLPNRLLAFEQLLIDYPERLEKVMLLQVAVPSRTDVKEYIELKEEMDKLVGSINGRFSTPHWSPIRYIYGCIPQSELAGYYRDADVALVTPLRDGMNLVAKEFVACRVKEPGVLILSPFAGAGETMHEALRVNPYEIANIVEALNGALTMPADNRQVRMNALRTRERIHDVNNWTQRFLRNIGILIEEDEEEVLPTTMQPVSMDYFNSFLTSYVGDKAILALLLDYDGTLAPIAKHPDLAFMPEEAKNILERLARRPDISIAIISGRSVKNVKEMVGIDGITYAGNHGMEILHADGSTFVHPMPSSYKEKLDILHQKLKVEACKEGAWIEDKGTLLCFHYREVPVEKRQKIVTTAKKIIGEGGFKIGLAHCALEIKPPEVMWDKGRASIYILRTAYGVDWSERLRIIYVGDDVTDEDAISALQGIAKTFRVVGSHVTKTNADRRLPSTDSVLMMLKWVERHMSARKPSVSQSPSSAAYTSSVNTERTTSMVNIP